jgi:hypothetical protein
VTDRQRAELALAHGYDVKFAYHAVRLLLEVEQILVARDIDDLARARPRAAQGDPPR